MFGRKRWDKPFSQKIARRVSRLRTGDLVTWADQSLYELGRLLGEYERGRSDSVMKDLVMSAEALHAVIEELNIRVHSK